MPLFDAYIFVDWSARSGAHPRHPAAHAVWVGKLIPGNNQPEETYHRTRNDGIAHITSCLLDQVKKRRRVLVGFDFPYGYPAGFACALALPPGPKSWCSVWAELADRVKDTNNNENNRFVAAGELNTILGNGNPGPFWGHPVDTNINNLQATSPGFPFSARGGARLQRLRTVEARLPGIQETWKLFGNGSVGSQALVGLPYVYKLRRHLDLVQVSQVWPFETQFPLAPFPSQGPFILHAEIWPGVVEQETQDLMCKNPRLIRDRAQVRAMCQWAKKCDNQGTLGQFFDISDVVNQRQVQVCRALSTNSVMDFLDFK